MEVLVGKKGKLWQVQVDPEELLTSLQDIWSSYYFRKLLVVASPL